MVNGTKNIIKAKNGSEQMESAPGLTQEQTEVGRNPVAGLIWFTCFGVANIGKTLTRTSVLPSDLHGVRVWIRSVSWISLIFKAERKEVRDTNRINGNMVSKVKGRIGFSIFVSVVILGAQSS